MVHIVSKTERNENNCQAFTLSDDCGNVYVRWNKLDDMIYTIRDVVYKTRVQDYMVISKQSNHYGKKGYIIMCTSIYDMEAAKMLLTSFKITPNNNLTKNIMKDEFENICEDGGVAYDMIDDEGFGYVYKTNPKCKVVTSVHSVFPIKARHI